MPIASKLIEIEVTSGDFEQGFAVVLRIGQANKRHSVSHSGRFPAAPELPQLYDRWQKIYRDCGGMRLDFPPQVSNFSYWDACDAAAKALQDALNHWFDQPTMRDLREIILEEVQRHQPARLVLKTHHPVLRKLPWHLWPITERRPKLDTVLGDSSIPAKQFLHNPVRVLAVLGNSQGIDVQADWKLLEDLPNAAIEVLIQPTRAQLSDCLFEKRWDILFFAGHSQSAADLQTGEIFINETERLTPTELKYAITRAGQNGLQLLILNSCDGLGIATEVSSLQVPRVIVMREPVPDKIAQSFLKYFLKAFSQGEQFFLAVRRAREQLHALEKEYRCASWLPVICQSIDAPELQYPRIRYPKWAWKRRHQVAIATAATLILGFFGVRALYQEIDQEIDLNHRMSEGEDILIATTSVKKKEGVSALKRGDYAQAVKLLEAARREDPGDPETLIYLNNAHIGPKAAEKVAVVAPIKNLDIAMQLLKGAAQKQDESNRQGGINGTPLKIRIVNDDNIEEIAKKLAERLVQDPSIKAVVGHNASEVSLVAASIYQGKLVMITPTSIDDKLTSPSPQSPPHTYIFRTINATNLMNALADYAIATYQIGTKNAKVAICVDSKRGEKSSVKAFVHKMTPRGKLRLTDCDLGKPMTPEQADRLIQQARQSNAKALLLAPYFSNLNRTETTNDATINLAKVSQGKLPLLGNFTLQGPRLVDYGDAFQGIVLPSMFHPDRTPDKQFRAALSQYWGANAYCEGKVTARTALAYDALQVVVQGLKISNRTREGLQKEISRDDFVLKGVTGTIQFQDNGDRMEKESPATLIQLQRQPSGYCYGLVDDASLRLSWGEKSLNSKTINPDKIAGIKAFAQQDWGSAIAALQKSFTQTPNDPEARIYLNNAKAAQRGPFLRIATSVPLDTSPEVAQEILRGVAQAQEEINQRGGINGKRLQVAIASDGNNPEIVKSIAKAFVEDPSILAIVGHNASEATKAGTEAYSKAGLTMITPTSFSDQLALDDAGSIFRMVPGTSSIAEKLAKTILTQNPAAQVAICSESQAEDYREFREKFITEFRKEGGKLKSINCDMSSPFKPKLAVEEAIQQGADTLLLAPYVGRINLAVAVANQNRLRLYSSPTLCTAETLRGETGVEGLQMVIPWHPDTAVGRPFAQRSKALWGTLLNCWREAMAYDATIAIATGLRQTPNRQELKTVLKQPNFKAQGASGTIQFSQAGTRLINPEVEAIAQVQHNGAGYWFASRTGQ